MSEINQEIQKLSPDALVALFILDTTPAGGPPMYFVQGSDHDGPIEFNGITFHPVDVRFEGLEVTGQGAAPTPTLSLSNTDGIFQSVINTYGDMLNCTLQRIRTYARFLDNGETPDPEAIIGPDIFRIERKVAENANVIEWELSAAIDQEGAQIPKRKVVRNTCLWRYRYFNTETGSFEYDNAECPYTGENYFDINDEPVANPADDKPSRNISCCEKRFGKGNPLPFGGFPGVGRSR